MQIFTSYNNLPQNARNCVVALGNFDGVHKGHQKVIGCAVKTANENGIKSAVLTFDPHPAIVLRPNSGNFLLTTEEERNRLIEQSGVDYLYSLQFNESFSQIKAEDFIKDILCGAMAVRHVVVGYDFIFGHKRMGNIATLQECGKKLGFSVTQVREEGDGDLIYSSTKIRQLISEGYVKKAAEMLGRKFSYSGIVQNGDKRGRDIGFPTANVAMNGLIQPKFGVYAVLVHIGDETYKAVANIGVKPTFGENNVLIEAHIFNFSRDIYNIKIKIDLVDFIREERKFSSVDELKKQISDDCKQAERML